MSSRTSSVATAGHYQPATWDLGELLPDMSEATVSAYFAELDSLVRVVEARRADLNDWIQGATLAAILNEYEAVTRTSEILRAYGALVFAANTEDGEALALQSRAEQVCADAKSRIRFVILWWQGLADADAERLLAAPELDDEYRHFLREQRRLRPYALSEEAERIIALKNASGIDAMARLHVMSTAALRFPIMVDGEERMLTDNEIYVYRVSPDPVLRLAAYESQCRVTESVAPVLTQMFVNRVHDWHSENVTLRGYASPMNVRCVADDLSDDVVRVQMDAVREHTPLYHRYLRLKARLLGMEKLRMCDLFAPLGNEEIRIPYGVAVAMILQSFADFDPRASALIRRVFDENHIDSELRAGKDTGLFCYFVTPELTPWVLLSYTELLTDAVGMAHELGHALQNMLCSHHTELTYYPISNPLVEVPSLFAEQLFIHNLLASPMDTSRRRALLSWALDEVCSYVFLGMNALFERDAHEAVLAGQPAEAINRLYGESLRATYADAVEHDESVHTRWVRISHYHFMPFYIYAYSFASLIALALYRNVQLRGEPARQAVIDIMAAGGSDRPESILRAAGIDVADPAFWHAGFEVISAMIDELEGLS